MEPFSHDHRIVKREPDGLTTGSESQIALVQLESALDLPRVVDIRESVRRHKVLFLIIMLVIATAGITFVLITEPVYTAVATVIFDPRTRQVVNSSPVVGQFSPDSQTLETTIETELQKITSRRVIDPVVNEFSLLTDPEFNRDPSFHFSALLRNWFPLPGNWVQTLADLEPGGKTEDSADAPGRLRQVVVGNVIGRLKAQVSGHSTAIQISFSSKDPRKAAAIVNAIAAEYAQLSIKDSSAAAEEALAAMGKRSDELRSQAANAESAVEEFRSQAHLVESGGASLTSMQISQITSQLVQAEADLAMAQARMTQGESVGSNLSASPDVLASPVIQRLREEEAKSYVALAEARRRSGAAYPTTISRQVEFDALREQIRTEIGNIVRSAQAARDGAQARVDGITAKLGQIWRQAEANSPAEVHLHQLMLEANVRHTLYEEFLRRMQEIAQQIGTAQADSQVTSPAEAPLRPSWPKVKLLIPCIALASVAVAVFAVICADLMSKCFNSLYQAVHVFGAQPVVLIPRLRGRRWGWLRRIAGLSVNPEPPSAGYSESIHSLRVQIRRSVPNRTVLFASAVEAEGKTETAISFSRQEARSGLRVLMIDADLRRPRLHKYFGGFSAGLVEFLSGEKTLAEVVQSDPASGLNYIASGNFRSSPIDLLSNLKMQELLHIAGFDRIIVDTPAVLAVADTRILAPLVDQTIYVVRWGRTPRKLAALGFEMLRRSGGSVIGPVFVEVDSTSEGYGGSTYIRNYLKSAQTFNY